MAAAERSSGIPLMEDVPWGSHLCVFYETEEDLFHAVSCYLEAGLQANEFCVWRLPLGMNADDGHAGLQANIEDYGRWRSESRIELIAVASGERPEKGAVEQLWLAKLKHAHEGGFDGLRGCGDGSNAPGAQPPIDYERDLHGLLSGQAALALCTYRLATASAVDVLDILRLHNLTVARRAGEWQFMETPELQRANAHIRNLDDALALLSRPFSGGELLTERERMVLAFLVKGASSKEAGRDLGISPRTVDFHRANIIEKLGARNTADAVRRVLSRR